MTADDYARLAVLIGSGSITAAVLALRYELKRNRR